MRRPSKYLHLLTCILLVPVAIGVGWWYYWPSSVRVKAEQAMATNDLVRAEELLEQLTRLAPNDLRVQFLYAQVLRRLKRPVEAQGVLQRAVKLGLTEAEGRREFALNEAAKRFTPNVEKNLLQALQERPDDIEILQALAEGCAQGRRWTDAEQYYTHLLKLQPDRLEVLFERGQVRLAAARGLSNRIDDAAADFREILRRDPDHLEARLKLAHCLMKDARMAEAKTELQICRQLDPERVEPTIGLAACAFEERDWNQVETLLQQVLQRQPASALVLGMLGDVELQRQRFDRAIPFFKQVVQLEPRNKAYRLKLAQAYRYVGQLEEAREQDRVYQKLASEKDPPRASGSR